MGTKEKAKIAHIEASRDLQASTFRMKTVEERTTKTKAEAIHVIEAQREEVSKLKEELQATKV